MSIQRSNCTNSVVRSRGLGMRSVERRKVLEMKCLRSLVEVSRWIEVGMKRCVGELE